MFRDQFLAVCRTPKWGPCAQEGTEEARVFAGDAPPPDLTRYKLLKVERQVFDIVDVILWSIE